MPLYEYECDACGHRFEVIQKFSDAPIDKCPTCAGAVHKLQSAPAFQFKGTGWYVTDYAKSGASGDAKAGKEDGKEGKAGTDDKKADSPSDSSSNAEKPATKPAATAASGSTKTKPDVSKT